jgi:hypothetical protein
VRERSLSTADVDELEDHLLAAYDLELSLNPGLAPDRAFAYACDVLGTPAALSQEFAKVEGRLWRRVVSAGWALFAMAFFLPVARYGVTFGLDGLMQGQIPGVEALILALGGWGGAWGVLSGLTNLAMGASFWRVSDAGKQRAWTLATLLSASVAINLCWLVLSDDPSELFVGYYAWLASFGVTGAGLWMRARALPSPETEADAVVVR